MRLTWLRAKYFVLAAVVLAVAVLAVQQDRRLTEAAAILKTQRAMDVAGFYIGMPLPLPPPAELNGFPQRVGVFGGVGYTDRGSGAQVIFSGYPDAVDHAVLTAVTLKQPGYSVSGLHVGDPIQKADEALAGCGLTRTALEENFTRFSRGRLNIALYYRDGLITEIDVVLRSTNKRGIVY